MKYELASSELPAATIVTKPIRATPSPNRPSSASSAQSGIRQSAKSVKTIRYTAVRPAPSQASPGTSAQAIER